MIDERVIIHPTAKIAENVTIGPWTVIGPEVEIGEGTIIGPHVVINGPTKIGKNNKIYQFASVGEDPQDKKYQGERTWLEIGDNNIIREYCTLNRGTAVGGGLTKIGSHNLLMAYVHVAHDCIVGDHVIMANSAGLAGHVTLQDYAIMSAFTGVHQFCVIGSHSFIGRGALITKDVPPYMLVAGDAQPAAYGLNLEGLKRRDFSPERISMLKRAYKILYRQNLSLAESLENLKELAKECPEVQEMLEFVEKSERGIIR